MLFCFFFCQYHPVLMTTALQYSLISIIVMPPGFFLFQDLWLFGVFGGSMIILELFVLALWKMLVLFDRKLNYLHWMSRLLWIVLSFNNDFSFNPCAWNSFHFFVFSSISSINVPDFSEYRSFTSLLSFISSILWFLV